MGGTCSVSRVLSLVIHHRNLRPLVFRVPKLLGLLPPGLPKKFLKEEHIHGPLTKVAVSQLPELPQDVLMSIFAHLEIPDPMRACSVCSSWRSAYSSLRKLGQYQLRQTPCLLYTSESAGDSVAYLYSLLEKRSYKLTLPEPSIRSRHLIGSSNGWLITADERSEMHILNPITCEQIALPSVITIAQLSFAWFGDDKWTWLKPRSFFQDCVYKDGMLYAVASLGEIHAFDLRGPVVATELIAG
ncbi:F-box/kelch-repeat protein At1g57790-like [Aegilops tauschii subsp. strangulata]|uniref:F-box/kelch-repeat protein At1g57790-like n=1 Tax=Aegilops tauschii subsp. strangulata TaxID=200361 RepID=UPI003CC88D8E